MLLHRLRPWPNKTVGPRVVLRVIADVDYRTDIAKTEKSLNRYMINQLIKQ